jgi:hypothetical protein
MLNRFSDGQVRSGSAMSLGAPILQEELAAHEAAKSTPG